MEQIETLKTKRERETENSKPTSLRRSIVPLKMMEARIMQGTNPHGTKIATTTTTTPSTDSSPLCQMTLKAIRCAISCLTHPRQLPIQSSSSPDPAMRASEPTPQSTFPSPSARHLLFQTTCRSSVSPCAQPWWMWRRVCPCSK